MKNGVRMILGAASAIGAVACAGTPLDADLAAASPQPPSEPAFFLEDILGQSATAVDALLGEPALVRREGDGEYRRYGLKSCALIVIVAPDETGAPRAAHVDAAALVSGEAKPEVADCLAAG